MYEQGSATRETLFMCFPPACLRSAGRKTIRAVYQGNHKTTRILSHAHVRGQPGLPAELLSADGGAAAHCPIGAKLLHDLDRLVDLLFCRAVVAGAPFLPGAVVCHGVGLDVHERLYVSAEGAAATAVAVAVATAGDDVLPGTRLYRGQHRGAGGGGGN